MKIANNLRYWVLIWGCLSSLSLPAEALDNYKEFRRDQWDFEAGTNYFYSEANYPADGGGSQNLTSGNHYQLLDVTFSTRYVPKKNWALFAWGNIGNAESKDSLATRTNSIFNEGAVGVDYLLYSDLFQLVPEFIFVMPFEKIEPTSDTVASNEGVMEVRSRMIAQKDFGGTRIYGWLGFNYRAEGRSFLMPWGTGLQFRLGSVRLGGELFGYQSVTDDTDENPILRTSYINSVNAGSLKYYGKNPSLMDSQVFLNWRLARKWTLQVNGGTTIMGSNTAAGFHAGGFIRYTFDLTEGYTGYDEEFAPVDSPVPTGRSQMYDRTDKDISSGKKVPRFRESTEDGVDQNLFRPRPTRPQVSDEELQKQLDRTEFEVELKSKKKRRKRP